jgi:hypothetical protein
VHDGEKWWQNQNEERENRYWTEGEARRCRMCYEERERDDRAYYVEWMRRQYFLRFHLENRQFIKLRSMFLEMLFSTAAL